MGARDRARVLFGRALAKAPRATSIWHNLGLLELAARRMPQAVQAFERAVDADPAFAPAWAALGAAHANSDRGARDQRLDAGGRALAGRLRHGVQSVDAPLAIRPP